MALVFSSGDDLSKPHTHVVVIGVGAYDFMCKPGEALPANSGGDPQLALMEQLTSPPLSAAAFARWVLSLKDQNRWVNPLGSLRVLIGNSGFPDQTGNLVGNNASCDAIGIDVRDWKTDLARCSTNVGIFYFCGHGEMQLGQNFVLAQDFGSLSGTFWQRAINISEFVSRMMAVNCPNQIFLIDACRATTQAWSIFSPGDANNLVTGGGPVLPSKPPVVFAVQPSKQAGGFDGQVSIFTGTVLKALDGFVAFRRGAGQPWSATQRSIVEGIRDVGNLMLGSNSITPDGFPASTDPIYSIPSAKVYALLSSNPAAILAGGSCTVQRQLMPDEVLGPALPPIKFETSFGPHQFTFAGGTKTDFAFPPILEVDLP